MLAPDDDFENSEIFGTLQCTMISELAHCSPNGKSNDLGVTWRRADLAELLELELAIRSGGILQIDLP